MRKIFIRAAVALIAFAPLWAAAPITRTSYPLDRCVELCRSFGFWDSPET
jgi:hypothetical protein